jgi:hypothetical protein
MTFLNSIILYGIPLITVPILIHLLAKRKKEIIHFSSLRFLKILESRKIKKLRIQQIILLILRCLIILFIIMAFSRPTLKKSSEGKFGTNLKTTSIIILDNSLSSMAGSGNQQFYENIKNCAVEITKSFNENDQIYIIPSSEIGKISAYQFIDLAKSKSIINDSKPSYSSINLQKLISDAEKIVSTSKNFNKEIFLLTDLQRTNIDNKNIQELPTENYNKPKLFILTDSQFKKNNLAVTDIILKSQILQKNKKIEIETIVANNSDNSVNDFLVNLYVAGRRIAQKTIDIEKRASESITFTFIPEIYGLISGFVEIENDLLEEDNKRFFDLYIPNKIEVLLISDKNNTKNYIKLALNPLSTDSSLINLKTINTNEFSKINVDNYDLLIFENIKNITNSDIYRLKIFLSNRKGIIFLPDEQMDINYYNNTIAKNLNIPKILSLQKSTGTDKGFVTFGRIKFDHPIFTGLFEKEKKTIDSPNFYNFFNLEKTPNSDAIIEFSNGNPFLIESNLNNGKIILFACPQNLEWSNFPLKGIFAPIMNQLTFYLSTETFINKKSLLIGDEISFSTLHKSKNFEIEKPDGFKEKPEVQIQSNKFLINFSNTDIPGIYKLFADDKLIKIFSVNIDPKESDLFKPNIDEIKSITGAEKIIYFDKEKDISTTIKQSRLGKEIGKYFLIATLILIGCEIWIEKMI